MKVTKEDFKKAMVVIETYQQQLDLENIFNGDMLTSEIGCRVVLSQWGKEMQGDNKKKGTIIDFDPWMNSRIQGAVTVKWDGIKAPETMQISHVEAIPNSI